MPETDNTPCVYFIQSEMGPVKIGVTSRDIKERLRELQTGSFAEISLLTKFPCTSLKQAYSMEADLHEEYSDIRIKGEWFKSRVMEKVLTGKMRLLADWESKEKKSDVLARFVTKTPDGNDFLVRHGMTEAEDAAYIYSLSKHAVSHPNNKKIKGLIKGKRLEIREFYKSQGIPKFLRYAFEKDFVRLEHYAPVADRCKESGDFAKFAWFGWVGQYEVIAHKSRKYYASVNGRPMSPVRPEVAAHIAYGFKNYKKSSFDGAHKYIERQINL